MVSLFSRFWARRRFAAERFLAWSGIGSAYERLARPSGAIVLMYHSVASPEVAPFIDPLNHVPSRRFERQMEFLKNKRRVLPLATLVEMIAAGETPPARTVSITFDDGYLDNYTVAAPILERLELPSTIFLATGYISAAEPQWADRLHAMFTRRTAERLRLQSLGIDANLADEQQRLAARRSLHSHLLQALPDARSATLCDIDSQLSPSLHDMPRLSMTWDDVRNLRDRHPRMEIGGHSRGHTDLRTHDGDQASREIRGCEEDIRRETGLAPRLFSFPYARSSDASRELVRRNGWLAAVGENGATRVTATTDRFALPRVEAPRAMTDLRFRTSGAYPGALRLFGRDLR
jgi:peptidoglycan/xylan/chitin deacetylase (PgdA/CDA1 family)